MSEVYPENDESIAGMQMPYESGSEPFDYDTYKKQLGATATGEGA